MLINVLNLIKIQTIKANIIIMFLKLKKMEKKEKNFYWKL